jgi:hypothetical protein
MRWAYIAVEGGLGLVLAMSSSLDCAKPQAWLELQESWVILAGTDRYRRSAVEQARPGVVRGKQQQQLDQYGPVSGTVVFWMQKVGGA